MMFFEFVIILDQAFYIDDFKQVFADHAAALLSIRLENNEERVALLSCKDNYMYLDLFAWNPKEQQFEESEFIFIFLLKISV